MKEDTVQIPLPKFTFLCGAPDRGQEELTNALLTPDMEILDFEEPLRDAVMTLMYGRYNPEVDLTKAEHRALPLFDHSTISVETYLEKLDDMNRDLMGDDYLGALSLSRLEENASFDIFERWIFRDCENIKNAAPFIKKFGPENCLFIFCDGLPKTNIPPSVPAIWLATSSLSDRLLLIRRELSLVTAS